MVIALSGGELVYFEMDMVSEDASDVVVDCIYVGILCFKKGLRVFHEFFIFLIFHC